LIPVIGPQGSIFPCCHVVNRSNLSFGNIKINSFKEIWEGANRKESLERLIPLKMCSECTTRTARINKLLIFLRQEYNKEPAFLEWLEEWVKVIPFQRSLAELLISNVSLKDL
jgi:hypothetical protein